MRWLFALILGFPVGLAAYALLSHCLLLAGVVLPGWLLPSCLITGLLGGLALRPAGDPAPVSSRNRWARATPWLAGAILAGALALTVYGSIGSTDRDWDGFVAWSLKARYLVPPVSLDQPYFTHRAVHAQGINYPLLQPLCLGALQGLFGELTGRLLFPGLYLLSMLTLGLALRNRGVSRAGTWLGVLAFALTPMWLNRGAGAVDSGYAELFLVYAIILTAAGLSLTDWRLVGLGLLLLPLLKPEGIAYGIAIGAITASLRSVPRRLHYAGAIGLTIGLLLWLPLRPVYGGSHGAMIVIGPLAILAGLAALAETARRVRKRTLVLIGASAATALLVAVFLSADLLRHSSNMILRDFVANILELDQRLAQAPTLLAGYVTYLLAINKYGLLFVLALAALLLPRQVTGRRPDPVLATLFVCGVGMACLAMLLSPDRDLDHVFRSRFDRLLLHWTGVGWLLVAGWLFAPRTETPTTDSEPVPG